MLSLYTWGIYITLNSVIFTQPLAFLTDPVTVGQKDSYGQEANSASQLYQGTGIDSLRRKVTAQKH